MIYSGFWRRFVALIIDGVVLAVPLYALFLVFPTPRVLLADVLPEKIELTDPEQLQEIMTKHFSTLVPSLLLVMLLDVLIPWLYYALMESSPLQATLGKLAMGSIVTDQDGDRITFFRATGRHFGKIISNLILMIGFLMAAFTKRKQALHDILAGCLVIQKASSTRPLYDLPE
ncbi:MAG: RDD family protein [Candidatus Coatesbacteria bacterium]|nr:RDD family protein [Candidatus Coatesbacteria bacterium]